MSDSISSYGDPLNPVYFTAITVATPGNGNVAWTTVDVSASVPPGTRYAVCSVQIAGGTNSGSYVPNRIEFRKDSSSAMAAVIGIIIAAISGTFGLTGVYGTALVPLTPARTFDYQKVDSTNQGLAGATIQLLGYV